MDKSIAVGKMIKFNHFVCLTHSLREESQRCLQNDVSNAF